MAKSKLLGNTVRTLPRRLVGDMAMRTDAILDPEIFTSIVHAENPASLLSFFGRGVGDMIPVGMTVDDPEPAFSLQTSGIASSYINIKEETSKTDPLRVIDNSKVPATILANVPFEVTFDRGILDDDESFHLRDQRAMGRTISRRIGASSAEYTVVVNGMPGETFDGQYLFEVNAPVSYGFGNSQGEMSAKSNTMPGDSNQYNTFFNPTMITRYVLPMSGSYMSDELYTLTQEAADGTRSQVNTGISKLWMNKVLMAIEKQLMYSTSNFDPKTKQILGRSNNSRFPERPSYAGIFQQMDQAPVQYLEYMSGSAKSGLKKIDRIIQTMSEQPGTNGNPVVFAMCHGIGYAWLKETLREGGLASSPIRITVSPDANDKITVGFQVEKYVSDYGTLYVKNIGRSIAFSGEYDLTSYNGTKGGPRSKDIYFFTGTRTDSNGRTRKVARYFTKEGQVDGHQKVNRGFVFGISKGLTGEGNGWTGASAMQLQEDAIQQMMNNSSRFGLGSIVDGNEYHCLVEGVPYFDPRGTIKLSLL